MEESDFKKALEKIALIMNGSIDVGAALNLDSEATTSFISESGIDFNSGIVPNLCSETTKL